MYQKERIIIKDFLSIDAPISKAKPIDHYLSDFKKTIEDKRGASPIVVFESTEIYHKVLQQLLENNNLKYVIMSPLAAAKIRKASIKSTKTVNN